MSLTHTFNLIAGIMQTTTGGAVGSGSIPTGTQFGRPCDLPPDGSWDNLDNWSTDGGFSDNGGTTGMLMNTRLRDLQTNYLFSASAQTYCNVGIRKTSNGMEVIIWGTGNYGIQNSFWWDDTGQARGLTTNTGGIDGFPTFKVYENNNVDFTAFKVNIVHASEDLTTQGGANNRPQVIQFSSRFLFDSQSRNKNHGEWIDVSNDGDYIFHRTGSSVTAEEDSGVGSEVQFAVNTIIEIWGRADGYDDTLLERYSVQAYSEAEHTGR